MPCYSYDVFTFKIDWWHNLSGTHKYDGNLSFGTKFNTTSSFDETTKFNPKKLTFTYSQLLALRDLRGSVGLFIGKQSYHEWPDLRIPRCLIVNLHLNITYTQVFCFNYIMAFYIFIPYVLCKHSFFKC